MSKVDEIEKQAVAFLLARSEPEWTEADEARLNAWLDSAVAHKAAYWRLEHGWARADAMAALDPAALSPALARQPGGHRWRPLAIAASLLAAVSAGGLLVATDRLQPGQVYDTEVGGHEVVPLADGSRIELNTATELRAALTEDKRAVWLNRGEAYFEVAHDSSRPFVVHAGPRTVTVLGTKFSVRRDGDQVIVSVVEGRVRVDPADKAPTAKPRIMTQGDIAFAQDRETLIAHKSAEAVEEALAWREGLLSFDQVTLGQAAREINRYNRRQIIVTGAAADIRIGGSFQATKIDGFVRLLEQAYGLRVEASEETIKISS